MPGTNIVFDSRDPHTKDLPIADVDIPGGCVEAGHLLIQLL